MANNQLTREQRAERNAAERAEERAEDRADAAKREAAERVADAMAEALRVPVCPECGLRLSYEPMREQHLKQCTADTKRAGNHFDE